MDRRRAMMANLQQTESTMEANNVSQQWESTMGVNNGSHGIVGHKTQLKTSNKNDWLKANSV